MAGGDLRAALVRRQSETMALAIAATAALMIAFVGLVNPLITGIGILAGLAVLVPPRIGVRRTSLWFLSALGILLAGYAVLGRGFAHVGVRPVYVGEVTLFLGGVLVLGFGGVKVVWRSPTLWALLGFMLWGAFRTWPYVSEFGAVAFRDGVVWGYGVFAVLVASALVHSGRLSSCLGAYGRFIAFLVVWIPVGILATQIFAGTLPRVPGSSVPIVALKAGDALVHLSGAAAFVILGLHGVGSHRRRRLGAGSWFWWIAWLIGFAICGSQSRGGLVAALVPLVLLFVTRPLARGWKVLGLAGALASLALLLNLSIDVGGRRQLSVDQLSRNVASIFRGSDSQLGGTRHWRLLWWSDIIDYTVNGEYFWQGKGYGINLADDDGYQVEADGSLRSPHNGHLTILARSGVPGALLWLFVQLCFVGTLIAAITRCKRSNAIWWTRLYMWVLVYWLSFTINGAFDVFLEGPQGGIWFWTIVGVGIGAIETQRAKVMDRPYSATAIQVDRAQPGRQVI